MLRLTKKGQRTPPSVCSNPAGQLGRTLAYGACHHERGVITRDGEASSREVPAQLAAGSSEIAVHMWYTLQRVPPHVRALSSVPGLVWRLPPFPSTRSWTDALWV